MSFAGVREFVSVCMRCPCAGRRLLFFAAAKKSRCRPAQGQRVKHGCEFADASERQNAKTKKGKKPEQRLASQTKAKAKAKAKTKTKTKTKTKNFSALRATAPAQSQTAG
ncbi:hypothetical protein PSAB6_160070 [Paraburkholderia sabiae]|nr:hypothetical protein PSAB6_160070 [Paraburkholderia sabiae]